MTDTHTLVKKVHALTVELERSKAETAALKKAIAWHRRGGETSRLRAERDELKKENEILNEKKGMSKMDTRDMSHALLGIKNGLIILACIKYLFMGL